MQAGSTGNFSRVLRLLEAAAAGRGPLDDELARAEQTLARLQEELAGANTELQVAQAVEERSRSDAGRTEAALRKVDEVLAAPPPPPPTSVPKAKVVGPPTLTSVPRRSASPAPDPRATALAQRVRLDVQLRRDLEALDSAGQRTAAAQQVLSAKTADLEAAGRSLEALRRQLWSKLNDPTFASDARVLVAGPSGQQVAPSRLALANVPTASLDLYQRAARTCPGMSWTILAAIGSIESDHGRSSAPGVRSGANFAGAMGPMQFLAGTWAGYGVDGDGNGTRDVYNPADAVAGAAAYLCASGAGSLARLGDAIWAYNHAGWYVDDVLVLALRYGSDGLAGAAGTSAVDLAALVSRPNLTLTPQARGDLLAGVVDPRVVRILAAASAGHRIAVSVIGTGHSRFVEGTDRVSNHFYGRAVDIYAVDGVGVSASNDAALELALAVMITAPDLRPDEFGSPWTELGAFPGAFSDASQGDHLHLGWRVPATP